MSDRIYIVFVERRSLLPEEERSEDVLRERRVFDVQDEDRALEVRLP